VPRHVVLNMHEKLQKSLEFIGTEGFSHVTWA
jgi:hypothetical protein